MEQKDACEDDNLVKLIINKYFYLYSQAKTARNLSFVKNFGHS